MAEEKKGAGPQPPSQPSPGGGATQSGARIFFTYIIPLLPLFALIRKIAPFLIVILIILIFLTAGWLGFVQWKRGNMATAVAHGELGAEQTTKGVWGWVRQYSPTLADAFDPNAQITPYAIDPSVRSHVNNAKLGVKILEFAPKKTFLAGEPIEIKGRLQAMALDQPIEIEAYCSLEGYKDELKVPAELLGTTVSGTNRATVFKDQTTELRANCIFPEGITQEQFGSTQKVAKFATITVVYDFDSKSAQRIWFLNRETLLGLQSNGIDPFDQFDVADPYIVNGKTVPESTAGPMLLGSQVDVPQPLTSGARYELAVELKRSLDTGHLQRLKSLRVYMPSVQDLDVVMEGEGGSFGSFSSCDFEYVGTTADGYKEYRLLPHELEAINKDCDKKSLRQLALSEIDCISIFKRPSYSCNFVITRAPQTLSSDIFKAEASYTFKEERRTVVEVTHVPLTR